MREQINTGIHMLDQEQIGHVIVRVMERRLLAGADPLKNPNQTRDNNIQEKEGAWQQRKQIT